MVARPPLHILLVEDSVADARLTIEALREARVDSVLHVVRDGVEATEFLRAPIESAPRPDLILLDLNLPRLDGHEVLAVIKSDAALAHIPVIVLTTSRSENDVLQSYRLRANAVVAKPLEFERFFDVVTVIQQFWLGTAMLARI